MALRCSEKSWLKQNLESSRHRRRCDQESRGTEGGGKNAVMLTSKMELGSSRCGSAG